MPAIIATPATPTQLIIPAKVAAANNRSSRGNEAPINLVTFGIPKRRRRKSVKFARLI
jgi:hypothetical protein